MRPPPLQPWAPRGQAALAKDRASTACRSALPGAPEAALPPCGHCLRGPIWAEARGCMELSQMSSQKPWVALSEP